FISDGSYSNDVSLTIESASSYNLSLYSDITVTPNPILQNQAVEVAANITNTGTAAFNGTYCAAYFDSNGNFIDYIEIKENMSLPAGSHYNYSLTFHSDAVTANPGIYSVYVYYKEYGSVDWLFISDGSYSNDVSLTIESASSYNLSLYSDITVTPNPILQNQAVDVKVNIENSGTGAFNGTYCAAYFDSGGNFIDYIEIKENASLPAGSNYITPLTFHSDAVTASTGEYYIYIFHKPDGGNWIQTPSGNHLNPVSLRIESQITRYSISGYIKDSNAKAINGATVTFSNSGGSAITNSTGYYNNLVDSGWSGSVTPVMNGYSFNPPNRSYSNIVSDRTEQNFSGTMARYSVSGYIRDSNNNGISGVTLNFSNGGDSITTDNSGYYSKSMNYNWSGDVIPGKNGYSFTPSDRSYYNLSSNLSNQNYNGMSKAVPDINVTSTSLSFTQSWDTKARTKIFSKSEISAITRNRTHAENLFIVFSGEDSALSEKQNELLNNFNSQDTTMESKIIGVNFNLLKTADVLYLNLFQNSEYMTFRTRIEERGDSDFTWYGDIDDGEFGNAIFVVHNDSLTGIVNAKDNLYVIKSIGDGKHVIIRQDTSKFPPDSHLAENIVSKDKRTIDSRSGNDNSVITVLVAYTEATAQASDNISSLIRLAVDEANQSYRNSNISLRLELVHSYQVNYTETGTTEDLNRFTHSNDKYMNEVHELRNSYHADICILLVNRGRYAGVAWLNFNSRPELGFGVVLHQYAAGYYTFAHEIGHIQGARHNPEADDETYPFPYGHGYLNTGKDWRTIMSYDSPNCLGGSCRRIPYWSNPNISYESVTTGTASTHNNARVLNETASAITNFRISESGQTITVQNIGGAPLTISSVTKDQNWLSVSGYPATPFNIAEGISQVIKIDVNWGMVSTVSEGMLKINSNDPDEPTITVKVTVMKYSGDEMPMLSVLPDIQEVTASKGITNLLVDNIGGGTMYWTAKANESWLSIIDGASGTNNKQITISYDSNSGDQRIGTITFSAPGAMIDSQIVRIKQASENDLSDGDIDDNGIVDLRDAVLALKVLVGMNTGTINFYADVNNDKKIGLDEAVYILQRVSIK
ncbi:M12 family metallo-peptidase, partial [Desulfobacterales bacterium HSG17]|nr:M12 family metallo-peptidase [Desulfobacterales bacterium HSG17]